MGSSSRRAASRAAPIQGYDQENQLAGPSVGVGNGFAAQLAQGGQLSQEQIFSMATRGGSASLPFQAELEDSFGVSLDDVEVHVGAETEGALSQMNAEGAEGQDAIALPEGADIELVGHEVAHWVSEQGGSEALRAEQNAAGPEAKPSAGAEDAAPPAVEGEAVAPELAKPEVAAAQEAAPPAPEMGGNGDPEGEAEAVGQRLSLGQAVGEISRAPKKIRLSEEDEEEEEDGPPADFDIGAALAQALAPIAGPVPAPETDAEPEIVAANVEPEPQGVEAPTPEDTTLAPPGDLGLTPPAVVADQARGEASTAEFGEGPVPTVSFEVPQVMAAYTTYIEVASQTRGALNDANTQFGLDVSTAAGQAAASVEAAACALRDHIGTAMLAAKDQIRTDAQTARDAVQTSLQTRMEELAGINSAQKQRVLDTSTAHQATIQTLTDTLAADALTHGNTQADALVTGAGTRAELARAAGSAVIGQYAGHDRANDIRITISRMASETATKLTEEAGRGAGELRACGAALRDKIIADGADFKANIAAGDQDTIDLFDGLLTEAQDTMTGSGDEVITQIDQAETDAVGQLDAMEGTLLGGVDETESTQLAGIEEAKVDACDALNNAIANAVASLDEQVAQVEAWLDTAHPSQWPTIVEVLERCTAELTAKSGEAIAQLEGVTSAAIAVFDQAGAEAAAGVGEAASTIDGHIQEVVTASNTGFTDLVTGYDTALCTQLGEFETAWTTEADEKIGDLDESLTEAETSLNDTSTEGKGEIDAQFNEATGKLDGVVSKARGDMASKADEIANQSWWDRFVSGLGSFCMGLLDALVDFLKVLGIILLIVIAVVLIVALVILIVKGAAALAAAAAAVAAFLAAAAQILAVIGLILTAIGVIFAIVSTVAAWMNPNLTTDEKWRATGKGVGDILLEFLPDFGIGLLTKADDVSDVARAVENTGDLLQGVENLEDGASGVQDVVNAANNVEELGDLGRGAENLSSGMQDAATTGNQLETAVNGADNLGDVTRTTENLADGANATGNVTTAANQANDAQKAFDAAKANGYGGTMETWQRNWDRGLRLSGDPPRWRRPTVTDPPVNTPDAPTTTPDAPTTVPDTNPQAAFDAAKADGYTGNWETWQRQWDRGLRLSGDPPRWRRPVADPPVTTPTTTPDATPPVTPTPDAPTVTPTPDAPTPVTPTPDAPTVTPDAPATNPSLGDKMRDGYNNYDPETAPEWLRNYREAARLKAIEDGVAHPNVQAFYELYKGIAMSLWQAVGGTGDFLGNLGSIWDGFFTPQNEQQAADIEGSKRP